MSALLLPQCFCSDVCNILVMLSNVLMEWIISIISSGETGGATPLTNMAGLALLAHPVSEEAVEKTCATKVSVVRL